MCVNACICVFVCVCVFLCVCVCVCVCVSVCLSGWDSHWLGVREERASTIPLSGHPGGGFQTVQSPLTLYIYIRLHIVTIHLHQITQHHYTFRFIYIRLLYIPLHPGGGFQTVGSLLPFHSAYLTWDDITSLYITSHCIRYLPTEKSNMPPHTRLDYAQNKIFKTEHNAEHFVM